MSPTCWKKFSSGERNTNSSPKKAREREGEEALTGLKVGVREAREKNETLGGKKGNKEPALGWKEKSGFPAPYNGLGEKMKEAC